VSATEIDRALSEGRSLVVSWLNRGTLHLVATEDYWWLHPLTTPPVLAANSRMLTQHGVSPAGVERAVELIAAQLGAAGPTRAGELRERLRAAGLPVAGPVGYLLLAHAGLRGLTVRGPVLDGEQAYVLTHDWLGRPPVPLERGPALTRLARRYLDGHGPAGPADLARWAGIGRRDARAGLRALVDANEAEAVADAGSDLLDLVDLVDRGAAPAPARPRLLGPFDPLMFGWVDRRSLLGDHERELITSNGLFRPAILARDRLVGGWRQRGGTVELAPFEPLTEAESSALGRDASDLVRFVGGA
jgi:Winged helix DNA-binding domain